MEIHLAGMNIDHTLLQDILTMLRQSADALSQDPPDPQKNAVLSDRLTKQLGTENMTPETISAAYARISRDPRSVDQLREEARQRVGKARRSNRNIIFGLGHASVAEHAVFNLDIIGVTRYLAEYIQSHRLCSFTEKSQRYIRLDTDYIVPPEIKNTPLADEYEQFTQNRFRDYNELCRIIDEETDQDPALAGEDARYILPLSVTTQMGMTVNARTLERLLQQAASADLEEFRGFGRRLFSVIDGIAPSVIKYTEGNDRCARMREALSRHVHPTRKPSADLKSPGKTVRLIAVTPDGDRLVAGALLAELNGCSISDTALQQYLNDPGKIKDVFRSVFKHMEPWDPAPRAFEYVTALFEVIISAAAYAQMKRHRMASMNSGPYDPSLGLTIPPVVLGTRGEALFEAAAKESAAMMQRIGDVAPAAAPYGTLACHRRRLTLAMNARELIHLSRLREDFHAQWDIRELSREMIRIARDRIPGCMIPACGKDAFDTYKESLGF